MICHTTVAVPTIAQYQANQCSLRATTIRINSLSEATPTMQAVAAPANDHAAEDLDALLLAFHNLGVHTHAVAHRKFHRILPVLFRFNLVE